jgi:iron-sulfur-dependent L-serine dehydratase single chain form
MLDFTNYKEAETFLRFFAEISQIPRGSGNTKGIADYLVDFAKARGLEFYRDEADNVVIKKPATADCIGRPAFIIQGHTDMVLQAASGVTKDMDNEGVEIRENRLVCAYAFAVSEENASGKLIVTSPTCGACGIVPSLVRYNMDKGVTREKIKEGLLVAGLIGVIVKHNASISGAECGCQAEIGTASSMGAGFLASINGGDIFDIERASEIALEHSLGLTCDPIEGYVQIPCIERNAIGAYRSMMSYALSRFMGKKDSKISLDNVIRTMYFTGKDLNKSYRETARGGLAKTYTKRIKKI